MQEQGSLWASAVAVTVVIGAIGILFLPLAMN
jgi:hypothetical protein